MPPPSLILSCDDPGPMGSRAQIREPVVAGVEDDRHLSMRDRRGTERSDGDRGDEAAPEHAG